MTRYRTVRGRDQEDELYYPPPTWLHTHDDTGEIGHVHTDNTESDSSDAENYYVPSMPSSHSGTTHGARKAGD